jgi:hypothetical protein
MQLRFASIGTGRARAEGEEMTGKNPGKILDMRKRTILQHLT